MAPDLPAACRPQNESFPAGQRFRPGLPNRGCRPMDLSELQVFLMVAKEGSFSRAAERLFRTQPAISLTIRKLEEDLGQPLFVRGARPIRLTDAGTLLREYAERLINLRDEVKKGLDELEGLKRGELSLGVNESSIHALLPALAEFRQMHPGVLVRVNR